MTHEERRAWIMLMVSLLAYTGYAAVLLSRAEGGSLTATPYVAAMLWTIGGAMVASILAEIGMGVLNPRASRVTDDRDREIGRLGDRVGQAFVVIGAVAAMLMAMAQWHWFWIANVIYLCFVLSAVVGSLAKVIAYRKGVPQW
ncbi:hypothetical protein [Micromonospora endophytica]|uniref:Uncharacterized protein n=1 Tax=Micromonospora endophytica TaxID=515350 RepID=A0A2W2BXG8_9ACTN|nr:hypothetical protein [Micromonospora endophytica]PZF91995.1 hypothetical protein C1I93_20305 [Micromonospora endophytica]RIW41776.1 hypothetical protein D3H59_25050 [Micromonospora endophytica]BCJ56580.1 hypothetical protein Jiend_00020 [Micromonospora endophytica]